MKIRSSLRNQLILSIFIGCLIPYFLGGLYLESFIKSWLYNDSLQNTDQVLSQVNELIERSLISHMNEEVELIVSLEDVINAKDNLNDYTYYSADAFDYKDKLVENKISDYFSHLKKSHKTINFLFLGTEDGGYMEFPRFSPAQSYDPRKRPWYINTINQDEIIMSEPYITNVTNEMIVSFTKQVKNKEQAIGVVGVSVKLEELTNSISKLQIGETGYVLVLSAGNKFIVSPKNSDWILKTPQELGLDAFSLLETEPEAIFETEIDGIQYVLNTATTITNGLQVISVMSKKEILQNARVITGILFLIYAITLALIFFVVFQISRYITRPILEIASVINHMTDFDFSFEENTEVNNYAMRPDEIGTVSSALLEMHHNYHELMTQVNSINNEINHVDLEKNSLLKIEVSSNNPFHKVISSINFLMDKVYLFFNELKANNQEIQKKNEQLTASEEELMAQLEEIDQQKEYINFLAYHDPLTELPNRRSFLEYLTDKISSEKKGAVILLDIDDFKGINDTQGHVFGDRVLKAIAQRLLAIKYPNVFISRFGGDEFLVNLECEEGYEDFEQCLEGICHVFDEKIQIEDIDIEIRFSMGVSLFPQDSTNVNQLIMNADLAMYRVKSSGKNGYKLFDVTMMEDQINKSNIETILREAIENDGFVMVYQPQVDLNTGEIHAYEALLRLKDYNISPAIFIEIAEKNGSINKIGRIVTQKVIEQIAQWQSEGLNNKPVSFNFSANQLHDSEYIEYLKALFLKYNVDPKFVEIEITENIFLENKQVTLVFLKQLKELGIRISIDDFGTGYSSLNYLTFLPVDIVKLDRSLSMKFLEIENVKVMDSLISLVHSLGLTVVAEGIEVLDQVKKLNHANCDYVQGYYFSKPLDAKQIPFIHTTVYDNYRD